MSTNDKVYNSPSATTAQVLANHSSGPSNSDNQLTDFLSGLEGQMKELWSQYVKCLDKDGLSENAKLLRNKYFNLYRCYRQNKEWKKLINN